MKKSLGLFLLLGVVLYLTNLSGNFWLSGWDNLHPEFAWTINIKRALFSAWQEYQGLGLPAGHGHAAELFREFLLALLSFFTGAESIRKIWLAAMLVVGPLGVCRLIQYLLSGHGVPHKIPKVAGIMGGLFYLIHPGTIQIFYLPYEAFAAHYGLMPWMIFSVLRYLHGPSSRALLQVFIIHFLGVSQFYIPTLFPVYGFIVAVVSLAHLVAFRSVRTLGSVLHLGVMVILANGFWLFSFLYYLVTNVNSQLQAYLNLMYSQDIYLQNLARGKLTDAVLSRGFLFDTVDFSPGLPSNYLLGPWREHFQSGWVITSGWVLFFIVLIGLLRVFQRKSYRVFGSLFLFFFTLMATKAWPFSLFNDLLRTWPFFHQTFRNPFTKFANSLLFFESILFAIGIVVLYQALIKAGKRLAIPALPIAGIATVIALFVFYSYPLWRGNLFWPKLKVAIPKDYFQLFNWFAVRPPAGRIANLPQFTPSGWTNFSWGYSGSGFLWYGVEQPILDRAFDVWQRHNENYYWELERALFSRNQAGLERVLKKYDVTWIVVDNSVKGASDKALFLHKIAPLLAASPYIQLAYQSGFLQVYRVDFGSQEVGSPVYLLHEPASVAPDLLWSDWDEAYRQFGDYINYQGDQPQSPEIYFPFRSLFTGRRESERTFSIVDRGDYYQLSVPVPEKLIGSHLVLPSYEIGPVVGVDADLFTGEAVFRPSVFLNNQDITDKVSVPISDGSVLYVVIPKGVGSHRFIYDVADHLNELKPKSCDAFNKKQYQHDIISPDGNKQLRLTSVDSSNCLDIFLPYVSHHNSYLMHVKSAHVVGRPLRMSVIDQTNTRTKLETYLSENRLMNNSFYVIASGAPDGTGYTIHFDNISLAGIKSVNDLSGVELTTFPERFLREIKIVRPEAIFTPVEKSYRSTVATTHPDSSTYWVELNSAAGNFSNNTYLVLSQSFHRGWLAYDVTMSARSAPKLLRQYFPFFLGKSLGSHITVNNWANGWKLTADGNQQRQIVLIFWPQYLVYIGLLILVVTFFYLRARWQIT